MSAFPWQLFPRGGGTMSSDWMLADHSGLLSAVPKDASKADLWVVRKVDSKADLMVSQRVD